MEKVSKRERAERILAGVLRVVEADAAGLVDVVTLQALLMAVVHLSAGFVRVTTLVSHLHRMVLEYQGGGFVTIRDFVPDGRRERASWVG